jgi:hypothetical protein
VGRVELARHLWWAVGDLPAGQAAAVRRFYLEGLTYAQAADTLGVPVGALKTRLHKARAALRHRFRLADPPQGPPAGPARNWRDPRTLAVHEAGHGVLYWLSGGAIAGIAIAPVSGTTLQESSPPTGRSWAVPPADALRTLMAGEAATFLADRRAPARSGDRAPAAALARHLTGGDDVEAALLLDQAWIAARERLAEERAWRLVQRVAGALLERSRLDGDDFRRLVSA